MYTTSFEMTLRVQKNIFDLSNMSIVFVVCVFML